MSRRSRRVPGEAALDLIPVLSLVVHIIPMLLLAVRFATIAQMSVDRPVLEATPAPTAGAWDAQQDRIVSVTITGDGFVTGGTGDADPRIPCRGACGPQTYDFAALGRAMAAAKGLHPDEEQVVIAPQPSVPWEVVVRTMDATRADGDRALFPDPLVAILPGAP